MKIRLSGSAKQLLYKVLNGKEGGYGLDDNILGEGGGR